MFYRDEDKIPNFKYITTPGIEFDAALNWITSQNILGFDTETNGLNPLKSFVHLIQIGNFKKQYIFDAQRLGKENIVLLLNTLNTQQITLILHNAKFDYKMILANYGIRLDIMKDTMLGNKLLTAGLLNISASYGAVVYKYCGIKLDKEVRSEFPELPAKAIFPEKLLIYSALDVKFIIPVYEKTTELLNNYGMSNLALLEYEVIKVTAEMELTGIKINKNKWLKLKDIAEHELHKIIPQLNEFFEPFCTKDMFGNLYTTIVSKNSKQLNEIALNYNSPLQLKPLLEKIIGEPIEGTGEPVLQALSAKHKVIPVLLEHRKFSKLVSTYGQKFIDKHLDDDGRIRTAFNQLGADSGRYTSSKPNLQQIPGDSRYREPFEASDSNHKIISADFSGQELRLIAQISKEPEFLKALEEKKDLHSYCGSLIFGVDYEDFFEKDNLGNFKIDAKGEFIFNTEMKERYRKPAKELNFGIAYGMGPTSLAGKLKISFTEAKDLLNKYFLTFPKIKETMDKFTQSAKQRKYAYSPLDGRRRELSIDWNHGAKVGHAINISKNLPFQGAGASTTKLAMAYIYKEFIKRDYDAKILLSIHDELVIEVHKDIAEACIPLVESMMVKAFNYYAPDVPMSVVAELGNCWIH